VLIPLMVLLLDPAGASRFKTRAVIAAVAFGAAALYADFGVSVVQLAVILPLWAAVLLVAQRYGLREALLLAITVALIAGAVAGLVPGRYALPVAAALIVVLAPDVTRAFNWRYAAVPAALTVIFLATVDTSRAREITSDFDCLAATLAERGITNVAAEHWTAKPLYFAARQRGSALTITQTDFAEGDNQPWMAPYSFFGAPTKWAVRSDEACRRVNDDPVACGQQSLAPVESQEDICRAFTLYAYEKAVPLRYEPRPVDKLDAIQRQFRAYVEKAAGIVARRLGTAAAPDAQRH
jgi:hypothetical protein